MKKSAALLAFTALSLAACGKSGGVISDPREWLSSQDGPKVEGVNATLLKSAQDAEASGNYRTAADYYQQVLDKEPDNVGYRVALADNVRKLGETEKSVPIYDAALTKDPANGPAREGKALALMQSGDFETAATLLTGLQQEGKATWRAYNALGIMAASRQNPAEALTYFEEAARLSPGNASVLNNAGLTLAMKREFEPALGALSQASSLSAARPAQKRQVDLNMALVFASAGRMDEAEAVARQYFDGPTLSNNMGFYAHLANDDALAKTYLNMALTQSKRFYPRAWENLQALNAGRALPNPITAEIAAPAPLAPAPAFAAPAPAAEPLTPPPSTLSLTPPPPPAAPMALMPAPAAGEETSTSAVELKPIEVTPEDMQQPPADPSAAAPAAGDPAVPVASADAPSEPAHVQPKKSGGWFDDILDF